MKVKLSIFLALPAVAGMAVSLATGESHQVRVRTVAETPGLVAFWDFDHSEKGAWVSYHDPGSASRSFPLYLKRIGDPKYYAPEDWPYHDEESKLIVDTSGPFGKAIRFNQGHIYGAVERKAFDGTPLDLHGKQPFTLIAWTKFIGERHMVAGIWDEGGWDKYGGRRQVALFGGLFGQKGVIAHVSATGASSFPQSLAKGSQYARCRAIDGQPFENHQWVAMATTYDPAEQEVAAWLNGRRTPLTLTDPVEQSVYLYEKARSANPYRFTLPIFSPRAFALKFNGYDPAESGICEHRLLVDLDRRGLTYQQDSKEALRLPEFRGFFEVVRDGENLFPKPIEWKGTHGETAEIPDGIEIRIGDEIRARLESRQGDGWKQVGTVVGARVREGAPFTFGRALGLGSEKLDEGSQLYLDGVAVFDRILSESELRDLSFLESSKQGEE